MIKQPAAKPVKAKCPWCDVFHRARMTPKGRLLFFCGEAERVTIRAVEPKAGGVA